LPRSVENAIDAWTSAAGIGEGRLFRPHEKGAYATAPYAEISIAWKFVLWDRREIEQILKRCILHDYWEIAFPQAIQLTITAQVSATKLDRQS
jgi:hypothetical protein